MSAAWVVVADGELIEVSTEDGEFIARLYNTGGVEKAKERARLIVDAVNAVEGRTNG